MSQSSKKPAKKRPLLDEDELKPKASPWDFFYGKTPSAGTKLPIGDSLPHPPGGDLSLIRPSTFDERGISARNASISSSPQSPPPSGKNEVDPLPGFGPLVKPHPTRDVTDKGRSQINSPFVAPIDSAEVRPQNLGLPLADEQKTPRRENIIPPLAYSFADFEKVFEKRLAKAYIRVCRIVFNETRATGSAACIFRVDDLAEQVGITKRHLFRVLNELEVIGFIQRGNVYNTPTKKGIELSFHPQPKSQKMDAARQYLYHDPNEQF